MEPAETYFCYNSNTIQLDEYREQDALKQRTYRKVQKIKSLPNDYHFEYLAEELHGLDPGKRLVWKSLSKMYVEAAGTLFPTPGFSPYDSLMLDKITFLQEISLFSSDYYKSIFLNTYFQHLGIYNIIAQVNGHYRLVTVDDMIPVYEGTNQPLWGMSLEYPWQLLLLKAWAFTNGGYLTLQNCNPFEFVRTFSYPNWRTKALLREKPNDLFTQLGTFIGFNGHMTESVARSKLFLLQSNFKIQEPEQVNIPQIVESQVRSHVLPQTAIPVSQQQLGQQILQSGVVLPRQAETLSSLDRKFELPGGVVSPSTSKVVGFVDLPIQSQQTSIIPGQVNWNQMSGIIQAPTPIEYPAVINPSISPGQSGGTLVESVTPFPLTNTTIINRAAIPPTFTSIPMIASLQNIGVVNSVEPGHTTLLTPMASSGVPIISNVRAPVLSSGGTNIVSPVYSSVPSFPSVSPFPSVPPAHTIITNAPDRIMYPMAPTFSNVPVQMTSSFPPTNGSVFSRVPTQPPTSQTFTQSIPPIVSPPMITSYPTFPTFYQPNSMPQPQQQFYSFMPENSNIPLVQTITKTQIIPETPNIYLTTDGRSSAHLPHNSSHTIIAMTKNNDKIKEYGLLKNSASYRIVQILQYENTGLLVLQTTWRHQWNGRFSIYDPKFSQLMSKQQISISLHRSFIITLEDFLNIFSYVYISFVNYSQIDGLRHTFLLDQSNNKPKYYHLQVQNPSRVDLSVVFSRQINKRNLKMKIAIMKDLSGFVSKNQNPINEWVNVGDFNTVGQFDYRLIKETDGICQNETVQQNCSVGDYIIKIKMQPSQVAVDYILNVVSESAVKISKIQVKKQQKRQMMNSAIMDYCTRNGISRQYLSSSQQPGFSSWVQYQPKSAFGFGFIAMIVEKHSRTNIICKYNPDLLRQQGFVLKGKYKKENRNVEFRITAGQGHVLTFENFYGGIPKALSIFAQIL